MEKSAVLLTWEKGHVAHNILLVPEMEQSTYFPGRLPPPVSLVYQRRILRKPILHFFTDTTFVKNLFGEDCLGPSPVDRGRKACKLSVICDDMGVVHSLTFHPANKNDCRLLRHTLNANKRVHLQAVVLCADKGYDTAQCRQWIEEKGMIDCIIRKKGWSRCSGQQK